MRFRAFPIVLFVTLVLAGDRAPRAGSPDESRQQIHDVIDQYASGFYRSDHRLIYEVCHEQISNHGLATRYWGLPFEHLDEITYEQLRWLGDNYNHNGRFDPETSRKSIRVFDVEGNTAAAELIAGDWMDFFHLARIDGRWKIVNVVWWGDVPTDADEGSAEDRAAVRKAVSDYIQGYYRADADRCVSGVHTQLDKRIVHRTRAGDEILREMNREMLRHVASTHVPGTDAPSPDDARAEIEIHQIWGTIASVRLTAESFYDYMHLVRIDGEWRIVNVLWGFGEEEGG
jgi:hypothetical protein